VTFTPEWRDGKPKRMATPEEAERSPRIVKVIRLESYEDALDNIAFDDDAGQGALGFDDYLLRYMLRWETRGSETLLNVDKLARPFDYQLQVHRDGQTDDRLADVPETFNYLLGLHVQTRRVYYSPRPSTPGSGAPSAVILSGSVPSVSQLRQDSEESGRATRDASAQTTGLSMTDEFARVGAGGRYLVYRGRIDHREVAVIWRDTEGWGQADYERDRQFVAEQKLGEGADEVFVNGDSFIPGARALEPIFKARMFALVE
jgi:adenine-specific DNA-methyltransferase